MSGLIYSIPRSLIVLISLWAAGAPPAVARTLTPVGVAAQSMVEMGDQYGSPEMYDISITVVDVARGDKAMDLVRQASVSNKPLPRGFEYLLVRVRLKFSARGAPGNKAWEANKDQFSAFSGDGSVYDDSSIAPPKPALTGTLHSGDTQEGWLAFAVAKDDSKPFMMFNRADCWFRLYK